MKNYKLDFPIFENNPGLVYLDNAASAQKPGYVIDGIKHFLEHDYANIHRGAYNLSEKSEELYENSKKKVAEFIKASSWQEINYTYNSTYAFNLLTSSFKKSGILKKGDKVLLSIVEHHANIVPWLILKEEIGIEVDFVNVDKDYNLDLDDLKNKLDSSVKVVSLTYVSNVTGVIFDLERVALTLTLSQRERGLNEKPIFILDASQAVPHFRVDIEKINCDFMIFTAHKVMADTGLGVLYGKKELLKKLTPAWGGGGSINWVRKEEFSPSGLPFRFEPGTPNITGAVSLLKALEYIEQIGGYEEIEKKEKELVKYFLEKLEKFKGKIELIGSYKLDNRIGVFTFHIAGMNSSDIADIMAENKICVRAGHHCTEPLMDNCGVKTTFRVSLYFYNDLEDIDKFFDVLEKKILI
ncbi:cysteine desulfurase [Candidatus Gracilibacteria bacterium]|nr:cysteine desulfurase [Candidatus Gracilibacteria bacterium]